MNQSEIERIAEDAARDISSSFALNPAAWPVIQKKIVEAFKRELPETTEPELPASYELYQSLKETSRAIQEGREATEPEQPESDWLTEEEIAGAWDKLKESRSTPFLEWSDTTQRQIINLANHFHTLGKQSAKAERDELKAEAERLKNAILSFGNGSEFDWNVLGKIDQLETELARLKSQPIEAKAGPPDLKGVPFNALFVCCADGSFEPKDGFKWVATRKRLYHRATLKDINWHIGPILPPQDGEIPKCPEITGSEMEELVNHLSNDKTAVASAVNAIFAQRKFEEAIEAARTK